MKIGEFAKACGVTISVLRFYDAEGLLKPVYIDRFTGYRYYSEHQISVCRRIGELKSCGFTLAQIKRLLEDASAHDRLFGERRKELEEMLRQLDEVRQSIMNCSEINGERILPYKENIDLPFADDEDVIGRWEITGSEVLPHSRNREVYFLPNGEGYWCYAGWTKGVLMFDDGFNTTANRYTLTKKDGTTYMTVEFKSYDYFNGGEAECVTLKKLDSRRYSKADITIKDNIDMPFVNDEQVLGRWVAHSYIERKSDFSEQPAPASFEPYFKAIEFLPEGECISIYGDFEVGSGKQSWTRGYVLRKFNRTACAYELKRIGGRDYLIIEWKSGDYRWGGTDTDYYVFVRS